MKKQLSANSRYAQLKAKGLTGFEKLGGKVELVDDIVAAHMFIKYRDLSKGRDQPNQFFAWAITRVFPKEMIERYREIKAETVGKHGMSESTMTDAAIKMLAEPGGTLVAYEEDVFKDPKLMSALNNKELLQSAIEKTGIGELFADPKVDEATQKSIDWLKWRIRYKTEHDANPSMSESWKKYFKDREASNSFQP